MNQKEIRSKFQSTKFRQHDGETATFDDLLFFGIFILLLVAIITAMTIYFHYKERDARKEREERIHTLQQTNLRNTWMRDYQDGRFFQDRKASDEGCRKAFELFKEDADGK